MKQHIVVRGLVFGASLLSFNLWAGAESFNSGPVFNDYGRHAVVMQTSIVPSNAVFKVAFDVSEQGSDEKVSRRFDSLARFINMHVANGVKLENIELALVVHGKASFDLLDNKAYKAKFNKDNPNHGLLQQLMHNQVKVYLCGQSAAYYDVKNAMLTPGVNMVLSAMTAHAQLNQQGYSLNPF